MRLTLRDGKRRIVYDMRAAADEAGKGKGMNPEADQENGQWSKGGCAVGSMYASGSDMDKGGLAGDGGNRKETRENRIVEVG